MVQDWLILFHSNMLLGVDNCEMGIVRRQANKARLEVVGNPVCANQRGSGVSRPHIMSD